MKKDGNISASEISEYSFCSVAWYMDKNGYPRSRFSSERMETGKRMHQQLEHRYRRVGMAAKLSLVATIILSGLFLAFAVGWI